MIDRIHRTDRGDLSLEILFDTEDRLKISKKPTGLWYSEGDSWREYCEATGWCLGIYRDGSAYGIFLREEAILKLDSVDMLRGFVDVYSNLPAGWSGDVESARIRLRGTFIDWPMVASDGWAGVECVPYFPHLKFEPGFSWHNGWDVPSGCVWGVDAIERIERVVKFDPPGPSEFEITVYPSDSTERWIKYKG